MSRDPYSSPQPRSYHDDEAMSSAKKALNTEDNANAFELKSFQETGKDWTPFDQETSPTSAQWVLLQRSNTFKRMLRSIWYGPAEPRDDPPNFPHRWSFTSKLENFPCEVFQKRLSKSVRILMLVVYCCIWASLAGSIIYYYSVKPPVFQEHDGKKIPIVTLQCNSQLGWAGKNNACGLDAKDCVTVGDYTPDVYFRCPSLCDQGAYTYAAIAVGDQRIKYRQYVIGGGERKADELLSFPYRADSFPCGAAVHAGIISPFFGGSARLSFNGSQTNFPSQRGRYQTDDSVEFDSPFPSSFIFKKPPSGTMSGIYDPRIPVLAVNILLSLPVFYLTESIVGYWIISLVGYWTLVMALDPPFVVDPHNPDDFAQLISTAFQRMLPFCFILYVLWKCAIRRTLKDGSPLAKLICWLPLFWIGVMNNVTFDRLPVDRLAVEDLKQMAGAAAAVGGIITTIAICAVIQAYSIWKSGRFRKYLTIYVLIILALSLLASLRGLTLRIHHYILGLILIPGCATRGTSAYLFQGVLLGLVISGIGRWDYASIVETKHTLLRGEAGESSDPPQMFYNTESPHMLAWQAINNTGPSSPDLDGYSLLINDVERYVGKNTTVDLDVLIEQDVAFSSLLKQATDEKEQVKLYLRVARANTEKSTEQHGDYTSAAVLTWPNGPWIESANGVTR
ncbi:LAMI_0E10374g1_1 [Lachancea mirantina]|uniref:LAMI_0E10374g1_1 n=1 Tax=Lachancea mirantina TaxID=1230905 RepID=A0A1G4JPC5_9SACH|nr:LAMI_0E10374g1_1 [Lachancea mirantina]